MKHINKFNEAKTSSWLLQEKEIEELCVWLKDEVNDVKITPNGNTYNIDIRFNRDGNSIDSIIENAEKMLEITKEYAELLLKLQDSGYEVSYQLLQTSQHLNFYNLIGKIQIKSKFYSFQD